MKVLWVGLILILGIYIGWSAARILSPYYFRQMYVVTALTQGDNFLEMRLRAGRYVIKIGDFFERDTHVSTARFTTDGRLEIGSREINLSREFYATEAVLDYYQFFTVADDFEVVKVYLNLKNDLDEGSPVYLSIGAVNELVVEQKETLKRGRTGVIH